MAKLPKFKTIEEEAKFWDTHSFTDFADNYKEMKADRVADKKDSVITVKMPSSTKKALEIVAKKSHMAPSTLIRVWTSERLAEETKKYTGN
jgi:hypothetical protein